MFVSEKYVNPERLSPAPECWITDYAPAVLVVVVAVGGVIMFELGMPI